jgi:acetolactate synthase-1/2/3 large subunit
MIDWTVATASPERTIAAADLVEGLADGGVPIVFGLDDPRGLFAAARRSDRMQTAVVHDERLGGFMADAYARVSGRPVACAGISAPGAVNLAPALLEAQFSCVPVVAVVGEFLPPKPGLRAFQQAEHASFLGKGLTKATIEVRALDEMYDSALRAAQIAVSGRPGPVLLLISDALLWQEASAGTAGHDVAAAAPSPDPDALRAARSQLAAARRPIIVAGTGVHAADAYGELLELATRFGIPVATSMSGKGAIDETHPLALGVVGAYTSGSGSRGRIPWRLAQDADVVLVVGSDLDALTTDDWSWPHQDATLIRIDADARELSALPGTHLHGDARAVLRELLGGAQPIVTDERRAWLESIASEVTENNGAQRRADLAVDTPGKVWPGALMHAIGDDLREADYVVSDASYSSAWTLDRILQRRAGRQVLAPRGVGTLGWGLAAAMGVKLAKPAADVTCVSGDGAFFYGLPDMETAARWSLDLRLVVLDNGVYGSQRQSNLFAQNRDYDDLHFGHSLDRLGLARSMGWSAVRAESAEAFGDAYRAALQAGGPWLIEVAVDRDARPALTKFEAAARG